MILVYDFHLYVKLSYQTILFSVEEESENNQESSPTSPKLKKMDNTKDEKEVRVVDEVILVDSEYDVILILSSDEDDNDDQNVTNKKENVEAKLSEVNSEKKVNESRESGPNDGNPEKVDGESVSKTVQDIEKNIPVTSEKISGSGMDVQQVSFEYSSTNP